MCMPKTPKMPEVVLPPERAQMRNPSRADTEGAGDRTRDRVRAGTRTILTSGSGVTDSAQTGKKTLLGA